MPPVALWCIAVTLRHLGQPMLSGNGSLVLILSLCQDEGPLQRWGLVT